MTKRRGSDWTWRTVECMRQMNPMTITISNACFHFLILLLILIVWLSELWFLWIYLVVFISWFCRFLRINKGNNKLSNSEQSSKGKVKTHKYINRQNQSTTEKLWKPKWPWIGTGISKEMVGWIRRLFVCLLFSWVRVSLLLSFLCCIFFCFVCLRPVSHI